jgi:cytochrome c oxidase subunit IV
MAQSFNKPDAGAAGGSARPAADGAASGSGRSGGHGLAHVMPPRVLLAVWGALVVLTWVTVSATHFDLGSMSLWVAMGIATCKAVLVALFFMHLRYDRPINGIIFIGTLLFATLFIGLALMDTTSYQPDLIPGYAPAITP